MAARDAQDLEETIPKFRNGRPSETCSSCAAPFRIPKELKEHIPACTVSRASLLTIRGATLAYELKGTGDFRVHSSTEGSPILEIYGARADESVTQRCSRVPAWAVRPAYGEGLGGSTVGKYSKDLMNLYVIGANDKGKRMNASVMLEVLRVKLPKRYDLPSEQFFIQFISTQNKRLKEIQEGGGGVEALYSENGNSRKWMARKYVDALVILIKRTEMALEPRNAYKELINYVKKNDDSLPLDFPQTLPPDFPKEASVKSKVSSLKSKLKKGNIS